VLGSALLCLAVLCALLCLAVLCALLCLALPCCAWLCFGIGIMLKIKKMLQNSFTIEIEFIFAEGKNLVYLSSKTKQQQVFILIARLNFFCFRIRIIVKRH
jgi:hypothetical protein